MLLRGGYLPEAFISRIACTIGASEQHRWTRGHEALSEQALASVDRGIYLAGGYWRAIPFFEDGELAGVTLVNPDCTPEECRVVERGIALLRHLEYVERP